MKILIVDDIKNDRMLLSKMLSFQGYDILEASNGVQALQQVQNEIPDLIISDIMMPEMDGFTLLRTLRKNSRTNAIPFVFYSASYVNDEDMKLGLSLGASVFLLKPLEPGDLFNKIMAVLRDFEAGDLMPGMSKISDDEYLKKYSERIFLKLVSERKKLEIEIEKRKKAEKVLQEEITERQKAEEQLRTASFYARSLIEASLDPLVTISSEGKITDVNRSTEEVTGVAREQLIGTDFSEYFTEPDRAREGYQEVFRKGFIRDYPLAIRHTSGSTTDVLYNATVYRNERGVVEGVFAAARDVTQLKQVMDSYG